MRNTIGRIVAGDLQSTKDGEKGKFLQSYQSDNEHISCPRRNSALSGLFALKANHPPRRMNKKAMSGPLVPAGQRYSIGTRGKTQSIRDIVAACHIASPTPVSFVTSADVTEASGCDFVMCESKTVPQSGPFTDFTKYNRLTI
ncbi:hypothetical protein QO002_003479 [Pararhizobium capsulatum DSM 1112]|uniref:Uncharacterized protein n=1 Tax=Pararhizobium capsulatum DSM 1112 TaxID=1121113 RepID=A0ABU0BSV9_9HYPH|nr:hypothetical protein [Pararhizobium capsulatum]MDQ0321341.1 hypothetical protein [Pararhizobium capsulatum DSM 1112]